MNKYVLGGTLLLGAGLLLALAMSGAYSSGYEAGVAELAARHAEEREKAMAEHAAQLDATIAEYERRITLAEQAGARHLDQARQIRAGKEQRARSIPDAAKDSTCTFDGDFVRLWNEAVGAQSPALP